METAGERQRKNHAQKSKTKFLAKQAALPEHERLDAAARDWDAFVWRQLSDGRETLIANMKQTFIEFLTDEDLPMKLSTDTALSYFKRGGTVVTTKMLRMFIEFMALSRTGHHPKANGALNIQTVHAYIDTLSVAFRRVQSPIEREIKAAAHAWVDAYLLPKGMVATFGKEKHNCSDISLLVLTIFSAEYMATMANTRAPLQLALFLTLATDCAGRVGEFIATQGKKSRPTFLRWRHVTITAFRTAAGVTLRGTLRFECLKDFKGDPNKHKTIPLRLLPIELAAEDSFRLLLVLGLIDNVFKGLRCWDDIQQLNPGPAGSSVSIKESVLDLPVFRAVEQRRVTESPLAYYTVHTELGRLGVYMGLKHRLLCGAIRRGSAYLLAMNCTKEERMARMGHKDGDGIYWNHYRNETSTVDFQAIVHKVHAVDVAALSEITLHRRPDAPKRPSQAAYRAMWQLPHIAELRDTQLNLFDQIIVKYGSMKQARAALASELKRYDGIVTKYKCACATAISAIFTRELADFFALDCPVIALKPPTPPSTLDEDSLFVSASRGEIEDGQDDEEEREMPNGGMVFSDNTIRRVGEDHACIDPVLLEDPAKNLLAVFDEDSVETQTDAADSLDTLGSSDRNPEQLVRSAQYRTSKTVLRPTTVVDAISNVLIRGTTLSSDSDLAELMISSFNHMFPSDFFHPGDEPVPGNRNCRFCETDFLTLSGDGDRKHALHSHLCHKRALASKIVLDLDVNFAPGIDRCSWVGRRAKAGHVAEPCEKKEGDFSQTAQWVRHLNSHISVRGKNTTIECRFGDCGIAEEIVQFKSHDALFRHVTLQHRLRLTRAVSDLGAAERLIYWCPVCFRYINQLEEDVDEHARTHVQTVNDIIHSDGYVGLYISNLSIIPTFCIFCVHDVHQSESIRFHCWATITNFAEHIYQHVHSHPPDTLIPCPASIDTEDGISSNCSAMPMNPADLRAHLLSCHEIASQPNRAHKKKLEAVDEEESQPPKPPKRGHLQGSRRVLATKQSNLVLRPASRPGGSSKDPESVP